MNQQEVITRLCALSSKVMSERFQSTIPADCFCGEKKFETFSPQVLEFIEQAVDKALVA